MYFNDYDAHGLFARLICDRETRLGKAGAEEIQAHPFFQGIDWANIKSSKYFISFLSCPVLSCLVNGGGGKGASERGRL